MYRNRQKCKKKKYLRSFFNGQNQTDKRNKTKKNRATASSDSFKTCKNKRGKDVRKENT